jgi:amidase
VLVTEDLPTDDLLWRGVEGQARTLATGDVSAADLLEAVLRRIDEVDATVNAFTLVMADEARAEAARLDRVREAGGELGPLHGVPVAIKEENDVAGTPTTYGGRANDVMSPRDGLVAQRLREAGAVIVGRTNMPEFGELPFTESDRFGVTRNPWDPTRTPGGSSGGTAAAVAAGMVAAGIGGDGGGSIRIPSASCGLFGLKPTRGRVSAAPWPDLWGELGTIGPLTRSVVDSALIYDAIRDRGVGTDRFSAPEPTTSFTEAARLGSAESQRPLRIGWSTASPVPATRLAPEHVAAVEETSELLRDLGHRVFELDPRYPFPTPAFLPQFFGALRDEASHVAHPDLLEPRTKQLLRLGAWARPGVVRRGERLGERMRRTVDSRVFSLCDVLLTPTVAPRPQEVPVVQHRSAVPAMLQALPMVAYCALWNVTGHPAAAVPAGVADDGLPTSVQLVGAYGEETTVLSLAAQLESVRPWADRRPPV